MATLEPELIESEETVFAPAAFAHRQGVLIPAGTEIVARLYDGQARLHADYYQGRTLQRVRGRAPPKGP